MDDADGAKARRQLRPNRGKNPNARWIVEEVVRKKPAPKKRRTAPKPEAPILEGETRCACGGAVGDDKTMAECEECKTWQHVVCEFGVDDESALPEKYRCWRCREADVKAEHDAPSANGPKNKSAPKGRRSRDQAAAAAADETDSAEAGPAQLKDKVRRSVAEAWTKILEPLAARHGGTDADAAQLALDIEAALYAQFAEHGARDPGHSYREQFRTLSFNLKDDKNAKLQADVVARTIAPAEFVAMSSVELRPPEMRRLASEIERESLQEAILPEAEPPRERISTGAAEVNLEPTFIALDEAEDRDSEAETEAMKEPLGPPPAAPAAPASAPDTPVWEGRVRLGAKLDFAAAGLHLRAPARADWPQLLAPRAPLVIDGAVPTERATAYLTETAGDERAHTIAALVLRSPDPAKTNELYDYLTSRDRVGAVEHSSPRVKDAYIVPVSADPPAFLALDDDATAYLAHLRAEHTKERLLLLTLILFK